MNRKKSKISKVTVHTRVEENPGEFRVDNEILFCNACDRSIDWTRKSTVDDHLNSYIHKSNKALQKNKHQQTIIASFSSSESKKNFLNDLIESFVAADIPIEKINNLHLFFKKYCKEGGAIPQASTLRQLYLPQVFLNHLNSLKSFFKQKRVAIIMDETTDSCSRSVVNTLFVFRDSTKLVSVNFLTQVNNSTMGQTLFQILSNYDIPFTFPRVFLSDSASYMKKCYRDILHIVMPQLVHIPCCAHILNLIG
jgi:hypothetical protein